MMTPNAYADLMVFLESDEHVESIVFGPWGWGASAPDGKDWSPGYGEPTPPAVPFSLRGKPMSLDDAECFMRTWSFDGSYGSPKCYAVYIWTDRRVIWVTQYDGSTRLSSAPRNPVAIMPDMPGG
jgi:hypothetical protein